MGDADINIDEMIARLLEARNNRPGKGKVFTWKNKFSDLKLTLFNTYYYVLKEISKKYSRKEFD